MKLSIGNRILSFLILLASLLPFWVLYAISDLMFLVLYYLIGYRKKVVYSNLDIAFPEKTIAEKKKIAKKFYVFLTDMLVETIKMRSISAKEVKKRIVLTNEDEVQRHFNQGSPVIGTTAHYGNWELGIHRLSLMTENPVLIIYKPLNNKGFEKIYNTIRSRFHAKMIPMRQTIRQILTHKNEPHISMFLSDQTPVRSEADCFIPFMGQPTLVFLGMEKIARSTGFPVVYCHIDRIKRGYYSCTFSTLFEKPQLTEKLEITLTYHKILEQHINAKPELWLWSHRRWKHKPAS
ncbi:lysophospholipid acyltransferase family protein [Olivibacter ginsenosidimutans]|uniref:Lysophospholipid acyltransferase family protein n=1 Tax=Olivibacter ginsenosidimutans TaxID=1176537 RepID=A0ABP9B2N6_9SPHI